MGNRLSRNRPGRSANQRVSRNAQDGGAIQLEVANLLGEDFGTLGEAQAEPGTTLTLLNGWTGSVDPTDQEMENLHRKLKKIVHGSGKIRGIVMRWDSISARATSAMFQEQLKNVQRVGLVAYPSVAEFTSDESAMLANAIASLPELRQLFVSDGDLLGQDDYRLNYLPFLPQILLSAATLKELDLEYKVVGVSSFYIVEELLPAIKNSPSELEHLRISHGVLPQAVLPPRDSSNDEEIYRQYLPKLALVVQAQNKLVHLSIHGTPKLFSQLGGDSTEFQERIDLFVDAASSSTALKRLYFHGTALGAEAMTALLTIARRNRKIEEMIVGDRENDILIDLWLVRSHRSQETWLKHFEHVKGLKKLHGLGPTILRAGRIHRLNIVAALSKNTSITSMPDVHFPRFENKPWFKKWLQRNKYLETITKTSVAGSRTLEIPKKKHFALILPCLRDPNDGTALFEYLKKTAGPVLGRQGTKRTRKPDPPGLPTSDDLGSNRKSRTPYSLRPLD